MQNLSSGRRRRLTVLAVAALLGGLLSVASVPSAGAVGTTLTLPSADVPHAIPDSASVSSTLVVTDSGTITDLDLFVDVAHTWSGDLDFVLEHVDTATTAIVIDRPGTPLSFFGCSGNDYLVTVNDEGLDGDIETQCDDMPAIHGDRVGGDPAGPVMAVFDGEDILGTWTLTVTDNAGGDLGTLLGWSLIAEVDVSDAQCGDLAYTIIGTDEADVIVGTNGDDVIFGGGGNDVIDGLKGNDLICGGPGDDTINGGNGNDILRAGPGNDTVFGGAGNDQINGDKGADLLMGDGGADTVYGGQGNDQLYGGDHPDFLHGGGGNDDVAFGEGGLDTCIAELVSVTCEK